MKHPLTIAFTGTRQGMTNDQKSSVFALLTDLMPDFTLHGCCRGADVDFNDLVLRHRTDLNPNVRIHGHPSESTYNSDDQCSDLCEGMDYTAPMGKPLSRNALMVKNAELVIGCPPNYENVLRSGTWSTIRKAKRKDKVIIVFPDGTLEKHIDRFMKG